MFCSSKSRIKVWAGDATSHQSQPDSAASQPEPGNALAHIQALGASQQGQELFFPSSSKNFYQSCLNTEVNNHKKFLRSECKDINTCHEKDTLLVCSSTRGSQIAIYLLILRCKYHSNEIQWEYLVLAYPVDCPVLSVQSYPQSSVFHQPV